MKSAWISRSVSATVTLMALIVYINTAQVNLAASKPVDATIITGSGGGGTITITTGGSSGGTSGSPGRSGGAGGATHPSAPTLVTIYVPYLTYHAGTSLARVCVAYKTITMQPSPQEQLELNYASAQWNLLLQGHQRCNATTTSPTTPTPSATGVAASLWQSIFRHELPAPQVTIPPGFGVVNIPSYLVTNGPTTMTFTDMTALGTLTIRATGDYIVSGTGLQGTQGPFASGAPWPYGTIALNWPNAGVYSVTVTEAWSATWYLDGQNGSLNNLTTTATIPAFHVESLQALRLSSTSAP